MLKKLDGQPYVLWSCSPSTQPISKLDTFTLTRTSNKDKTIIKHSATSILS